MNYRHLAVATLLFGMGWSTNVVYEVQTGKNLWRGLASEAETQIEKAEKVLTAENLKEHIDGMDTRADEMVSLHKEVKEGLENKDVAKLISIRDEKLPKLKEVLKKHEEDHDLFKAFMDQEIAQSEQDHILEDVKRIASILEKVEDIKIEVISGDINDLMKIALEEKALAQEKTITELSENICRQNRELSSLTTKIEDLIKKQEKVFARVEKEEEEKKNAEKENQVLALDPAMLFEAFSSPYQMPSQDFFNMPQMTGLQSQSNPFGIDMNFLMMTKMLSQTSGFGPRASVNYAPVYNQQRTYYGMPNMNYDLFQPQAMNQRQEQMPQLPNQGTLLPGFNFTRGNGNAGEIPLGIQ